MDGSSAIWGPTARPTARAASRSATASLRPREAWALGTAVVDALVERLATVPEIRRLTAITGAQNAASRRLLERRGFHITGLLPGTDEVRYTLSLS